MRFFIGLIFCFFVCCEGKCATMAELQLEVEELQQEINRIEKDLANCKKEKRGWTAGTVLGGVGVVATGVGIGVKLKNLNQLKKDQKDEKSEDAKIEQSK